MRYQVRSNFVSECESRALQTCHQHLMKVPGNRVCRSTKQQERLQCFTLLTMLFISVAASLPADALQHMFMLLGHESCPSPACRRKKENFIPRKADGQTWLQEADDLHTHKDILFSNSITFVFKNPSKPECNVVSSLIHFHTSMLCLD